MATTTKKGRKTPKAKPRRPKVKTSEAKQAHTISELRLQLAESLEQNKAVLKELQDRDQQLVQSAKELQDCKRQVAEALEQQTATSKILGVIASSPTDIQPVLDVVAENAARLCAATDAQILRVQNDVLRLVASYGGIPGIDKFAISRGTPTGRAVVDCQTIHVQDIAAEVETEFPGATVPQQLTGTRTLVATPLLREGVPLGVIVIRRTEVRPFTERQVKLLETFASQAVIAIENVRLFQELQERNAELREALEHQTATAEVLSIISRSPTAVQPVLDAIVESAARVCGVDDVVLRLREGNMLLPRAHFGSVPIGRVEIGVDELHNQWIREHGTLHIPDVHTQRDVFPTVGIWRRARTYLIVPLRQQGEFIGTLNARRVEVRPFSPAQIKLLETFADQAVIAIENVRLFKELEQRNRDLTQALEQQNATSKILEVIASSPTDLQPVMDAIAESAARLCHSHDAQIYRLEGDIVRKVASHGIDSSALAVGETRPISRRSVSGRAMIDQQTIHLHDMLAEREDDYPDVWHNIQLAGIRTTLATPLLRESVAIGAILIRRTEVHPFTDKQIALLKTFADQAVIAIENVRLFKEIQERNAELREALEHQTATSEVLGIISRSPTDVQPVLDAIVESAAKVCGIDDVVLRLYEGNKAVARAHFGPIAIHNVEVSRDLPRFQWMREHGTLHVPDVRAQNVIVRDLGGEAWRTHLSVPLRQQEELIGHLSARRTEVRPFSPAQIKLLETFADQAVIAIENVRLFNELKESLEQQTATSEILGAIASSPTDIQPVLDTVIANAVKLSGATKGHVRQLDGEFLRVVAHYGETAEEVALLQSRPGRIGAPFSTARAFSERKAIQIADAATERGPNSLAAQRGARTLLSVPLLREGMGIGVIVIWRDFVEPFTERQIELVKTFADQAVIAIENVRLFKELQERNRDLTEALEQQTATSEILRVIASSPTDVQPVLNAVAESAARLCSASDANIRLRDGDGLRSVANYGPLPSLAVLSVSRGSVPGRAVVDQRTVHIADLAAESDDEFPESKIAVNQFGFRTVLATPLLREGVAIGEITIRRTEVRPFSDSQIKLLETFADQAVIAIENVRLFKEIQERNAELREALEHQTATAEVLGIISRSPTDVQPVLDAIVESAAKVCGINDVVLRLYEGNNAVARAHFGPIPIRTVEVSRDLPRFRWMREHGTLHIPDLRAQNESPLLSSDIGWRTHLSVPLRQQEELIGHLSARHAEVRPFTPAQIKLLETFADQAVIAIENVRLFNELKELLEQQTGTSEILGVIASSPTDLQPVLEVLVESAARLCESNDAQIFRLEGNILRRVAVYGDIPAGQIGDEIAVERGSLSGRAVVDRQAIHVHDLKAEPEAEFPLTKAAQKRLGVRTRTVLAMPLLREGFPIGAIAIRRSEVRPFTEKQIKLLETFAAQAVIAIENVRLFQELEARTRELVQSVGELKALGEVGQAVSSTLDLETVLTRIVSHAVQLSGTDGGAIYEYDESSEEFLLRATDHMEEELINALRGNPPRLGDGIVGRAAVSRQPVQVPNILEERAYAPRMRQMLERYGFRASLAVPLLREDRIIGGLVVRRKSIGEFRPEVIELLKTFATQSVLAIQNARLFREIEDKSRQIEAANRHKSEFLANMSHELRTPLTAIIGFSEVLSDKIFGELNDKQNEYMGDIVSSGRHLLSLINDILDLSKVEAGRMELDVTRFDVPMAIENALILIRERATRHGIKVEHKIDERLGEVVADERKFKQILLNLLSNAVKFTPEGGSIGVTAVLTKEAVEVAVSDTGIGIAPENHGAIFEEFRQVGTDASKKREGTGLGLTLTKKFVELHGGRIRVESAVGKGSTFTFTLPLNQENFDGARISSDH